MASLNEAESDEHKRLVKAIIDELKKQGFEILTADYNGYEPSQKVVNHVPDVKAWKRENELVAFGEAKTSDDFDNDRTKEQFIEFSNRRMKDGKSKGATVPLCIGITNGSEKELEACLVKLGLDKKTNIYKWSF